MLAIQGDYAAHADGARGVGRGACARSQAGRLTPDAELNGLIIPGGESTTFLKFLERDGFLESLRAFAAATPTFGTCAGCILLATNVLHPPQDSLGVLDATVERNAYGRQIDSSIEETATRLGAKFDTGPLETVYIRAPRIQRSAKTSPFSPSAMASLSSCVRAICSPPPFHPELSTDRRVHRYFVDMVREAMTRRAEHRRADRNAAGCGLCIPAARLVDASKRRRPRSRHRSADALGHRVDDGLLPARERSSRLAVPAPAPRAICTLHLARRIRSALGLLVALYIVMAVTAEHLWARERFEGAAPAALHVEVVAQQFQWYFHYPGTDAAYGTSQPQLVNAALGNPIGLDPADQHGKR